MERKRFWTAFTLFFVIMFVGLAADLGSKAWVFEHYWPPYQDDPQAAHRQQPVWVLGENLGIETSTNAGASFGMMQGYQPYLATLGFVTFAVILLWVFAFSGWKDRVLTLCLGSISGGILGNAYDRLGLWHQELTPEFHYNRVRDFIHFKISGVPLFDPWPNFNIADSLLVCGVLVLVVKTMFFSGEQVVGQEAEKAKSTTAE